MDAKTLFNEKLPKSIEKKPERARELDAIYRFVVTGDGGGTWTLDCKSDPPTITEGETVEPECTIELTDEDFAEMLKDPQMAMQLFFQGKIKVSGDPMLATKLSTIFGMGG
jgi:putative sterol carrier protein